MKKKLLALMLSLTVAISMCGVSLATAEVSKADTGTALAVYSGETVVKEFTVDELIQLAGSEGNKKYEFSAFNTYSNEEEYITYKGAAGCEGPTVSGIVKKAGINPNSIPKNRLIILSALDGRKFAFTADQLFGKRYYYPNAKTEAGPYGSIKSDAAYEGKTEVPTIYHMEEKSGQYEAKVAFGQVEPNEQNYSAWPGYMLSKEGSKYTSSIIITNTDAVKWPAIQKSKNEKNNGKVAIGTKVILNTNDYEVDYVNGFTQCWVHYTTDGSDPTARSPYYNYSRFNSLNNPPIIEKIGTNTIKFMETGYGKLDSDISTLTYIGVPAKPVISSITPGKRSITLKWKAAKGAEGYKIYRATKSSGKYKLVKTISGNTLKYKNTGLKKGNKYYYKLSAFAKADDKTYTGSYSKVKYAKAK